MIRSITNKINENISSKRLYDTVNDICKFHRIQASPGYRLAAKYCHDKLKGMGIESEILSFKASLDANYLLYKGFKEWNINSARCDLIEPYELNLADFSKDPLSVIQRSMPCDYSNEAIEIVEMDKGTDEQNYEDYDLNKKILFVHEGFNKFMWAIKNRNALGFISDYAEEDKMKTRENQYDFKKYMTFSYYSEEDKSNCFGFMISPRQGDMLKEICLEMKEKDKLPKVTCHVDSSLYDGEFEVVTGFLPGETDEEILVMAHLCHPRTSANDNASGVSASMEALNAIKTSMDKGVLKGLNRGIRLILIPEYTGTYAYISSIGDGSKKILAGINLDMVGGRQSGKCGPLNIVYLPYSTPSFVSDLGIYILDELKKDASAFGQMVSTFNSGVIDCISGSDHLVLCDPTINIPSPAIIEFPDLYYHSSGDTIDNIDENILKKSCAIAATYCYSLSNLNEEMAQEIFNSMNVNMVLRLSKIVDKALNDKLDGIATDAFNHIYDFYIKSCESIIRFIPDFHGIDEEKKLIGDIYRAFMKNYSHLGKEQEPWQGEDFIPKRLFKGPIYRLNTLAKSDDQRKLINDFLNGLRGSKNIQDMALHLIVFYMDGVRKMSEISTIVNLFKGLSKDIIKKYVDLLVKLDLVEKL
ncbi:MAG: DUF4910 domain-containing protein [Oscillospiraceae bacterium]|nr:DUF4910 domain-containing protein [Oscillospiraceae bacterium]